MSIKAIMHIRTHDKRLGKVEKVLDNHQLLVWFDESGPPETISSAEICESMDEKRFNKLYYAKKGIIIR